MTMLSTESKVIIGTLLVSVILLIGGIFFVTNKENAQENAVKADPQFLVREDSFKKATDSAIITLVEFGDFECPACGAAYPTIAKLLTDNPGKITFVYRHFPLTQHSFSNPAAQAAEAAGAQGKYWEMYAKLFENQRDWGEALEKELTPLNRGEITNKAIDMFSGYANELGLDFEKLKQEVRENKYADKVQRDQNDGFALGVSSTPTFFLDGEKLPGVPDEATIKAKIDAIK